MTHLIALVPSLKKVFPSLPLSEPGVRAVVVYRLTSDVRESDRFIVGVRYATFASVDDAFDYLKRNVEWYGDQWDGPSLATLEAEYMEYVRCRNRLKLVR